MKAKIVKVVAVSDGTFACAKCGKGFPSASGARMHYVRVHTRAGQTGAAKGAKNASVKKQTREMILAKKREYNKLWRIRNLAKGLTSTGQQWKRRPKERRRKYERGWDIEKAKKRWGVYPTPEESVPKQDLTGAFTPDQPKFCPNCGEEIAKWRKE